MTSIYIIFINIIFVIKTIVIILCHCAAFIVLAGACAGVRLVSVLGCPFSDLGVLSSNSYPIVIFLTQATLPFYPMFIVNFDDDDDELFLLVNM